MNLYHLIYKSVVMKNIKIFKHLPAVTEDLSQAQ
jgi:hypothetical protein